MGSDENATEFLRLLREYTDGRVSGAEFMHEYIAAFKREDPGTETTDEVYEALNALFFACDPFCPDEDPERIIGGIGEDQFFREAAYARKVLEELLDENGDDDVGG